MAAAAGLAARISDSLNVNFSFGVVVEADEAPLLLLAEEPFGLILLPGTDAVSVSPIQYSVHRKHQDP